MSSHLDDGGVTSPARTLRQEYPIERRNLFKTNREHAWTRTEEAVEQCFENGEYRVIRSAPGTGKTHSLMSYAQDHDTTVVLALSNYDLIDEKVEKAEKKGLEVHTIKSADKKCPTYLGHYDEDSEEEDWSDRIARMSYSCGLTPSLLHKWTEEQSRDDDVQVLPCCRDGKCEYSKQFDADYDAYDMIVTTHKMLLNDKLLEERNVAIDEFDSDVFIDDVERIQDTVNTLLRFLKKIDDGNDMFSEALERFEKYGHIVSYDEAAKEGPELASLIDDLLSAVDRYCERTEKGGGNDWLDYCRAMSARDEEVVHASAPRLLKAKVWGDEVGQTIVHQKEDAEVKLNGSTAKTLTTPSFKVANSAIGLDATASKHMWQKFCYSKMDVFELTNDEEREILWEQNGGRAYKVAGDGHGYYASGILEDDMMPTSMKRGVEAARKATDIAYDDDPLVFSTLKVKNNTEIEVDRWFGRHERGMNTMSGYDTMILVGARHPGDTPIEKKAEWFGIDLDTESIREETDEPIDGVEVVTTNSENTGSNLTYSVNYDGTNAEQIDHLQRTFSEDAIEQAIWRVNRLDETGADVFLVTDVQPDWLPIETQVEPHSDSSKKKRRVREIVKNEGPLRTCEVKAKYESRYDNTVSDSWITRILTEEPVSDFIKKGQCPTDGRAAAWDFPSEAFSNALEIFSNAGIRKNNVPDSELPATTRDNMCASAAEEIKEIVYETDLKVAYTALSLLEEASSDLPE
ncbi:hypothetical protein [Halomicrococcus sp. SG-WS-1]|uniref:hypothetical protein n=1 Tax=Halomicrococcus sp. SG-WS-1 TaxID=3439057 RepID=UPI003F79446B